ncbi:MAG: hypothetical protein ACRBEQ_07320 [Hyphomonas sp.]
MTLTLRQLEEGRRIAALVVRHCGDKYFPLFDRFDREIRKRRTGTERIDRVLSEHTSVSSLTDATSNKIGTRYP